MARDLKSLRTRIASVRSTFKITRAMQMVAASRLRLARRNKEQASSYTDGLDEISGMLSGGEKRHQLSHDVYGGSMGKRPLLLLITAQRGLCGGFNNALIQKARSVASDLETKHKNPVSFLCLGSKGYDDLVKHVPQEHMCPLLPLPANDRCYACARDVARRVWEHQETERYPYVVMVSNRFINVMQQEPKITRLLPFDVRENPLEMEPDTQPLMEQFAPLALESRILEGILGNNAGEQAARMTSMDSASRNAQDMAENLNLLYNRARQAMITSELTEMVSSVENL